MVGQRRTFNKESETGIWIEEQTGQKFDTEELVDLIYDKTPLQLDTVEVFYTLKQLVSFSIPDV